MVIRKGLTEDELELFDLIKKEKMTKEETQKIRLAAKSLLHRLREETPKVLVQDWFKDGQSRTRVRTAVETVLDEKLPETYDRAVFTEKCNKVFETHVFRRLAAHDPPPAGYISSFQPAPTALVSALSTRFVIFQFHKS